MDSQFSGMAFNCFAEGNTYYGQIFNTKRGMCFRLSLVIVNINPAPMDFPQMSFPLKKNLSN
jgi:hypothetical protein